MALSSQAISTLPPRFADDGNNKGILMSVQPIPPGYHSITPYLIVNDGEAAIAFYKQAFGATELMRMAGPDGKIGHAEIRIGNSPLMLADEHPEMGARSPQSLGGTPVSMLIYLDDVDVWFPRAVSAGGQVVRPLADQFYGDRSGTLVDPFGHMWTLATHREDVSHEELQRRAEAFLKEHEGT